MAKFKSRRSNESERDSEWEESQHVRGRTSERDNARVRERKRTYESQGDATSERGRLSEREKCERRRTSH